MTESMISNFMFRSNPAGKLWKFLNEVTGQKDRCANIEFFERRKNDCSRYTSALGLLAMAIGLTSLAVLTVLAVDAIRKCHHRQPARGA